MHPKKAHLFWNVRESLLVKANNGLLKEEYRFIGSSGTAVSAMLARGDMMVALMPAIVSLSANSQDWDKRLNDYFSSMFLPIEPSGYPADLSFTFDVNDMSFKDNIASLSKLSGKKFETSEELTGYLYSDINGKPTVPFDTLWKYGTPNNVFHYILFIYTQKLNTVANHFSDVEKTPKIKFYWNSEEDLKKVQTDLTNSITKAIQNLSKVITDDNEIRNLLQVMLPAQVVASLDTPQARIQRLKQIADTDPNLFNKTCGDKHLSIKAMIERMIFHGILKRFEGSSLVVDGSDETLVVGNSLEEVIVFFNTDANKDSVNKYKLKLKKLNENG